MEKNTKIIVELVVVLVLVFFGYRYMKENSSLSTTEDNTNQEVVSTEDTTEGSVTTGTGTAPLAYSEALVKYKDTRIQLDQKCQASPANATYKNNTSIMIDNRSSVARMVKVGSTFSIKAWGFKIVKLSSATVPTTWYVDCGTSQNVATILIQK